jgi:hypothetical protein
MIDGFPPETEPPTPSEYAVIAGLICGALIIAGLTGFVFAFIAPPEKHALALQVERLSGLSLASGLLFAIVIWLFRKFTG